MENQHTAPAFAEVVDIQFRPGQKIYYFDPAGIQCKAGMQVIIDTARGPEFGLCTADNHRIPTSEVVAPLRPVIRIATEQDKKTAAENQQKEKKAFDICLKKIEEFGLDMQLVSAECSFDGTKILFFFTADDRVDFRELVKVLANTLHARIELRQIGVRDKAKMVGGLGICGRPFCCATFLDDFQPVSIKMAKTQNLSLNPTKISGTCGRLMCCLKYEQDAYEDLLKTSPKAESFVDTPDGRGTVVEVDLLRQRVKVRMEENPDTIGTYANTDIAVLRSGKAKKNDPPIPDDLAPISGNGKRKKRMFEDIDSPVMLDSIKMRYSTETIAEEQVVAPEEPEEATSQQGQSRSRNRRRRARNKLQAERAAESAAPAPKQTDAPASAPEQKPAEAAAEKKPGGNRKHHRRYHHRRPKSPGNKE